MDIVDKIKRANLVGRGGACFSVAKKWTLVKNTLADKKYVVANAAEGEPGVYKDQYILERYAERVIDGMKIAMAYLGAAKGYLYLNHSYSKKLSKKLNMLLKNTKIEIFVKPVNAGYIGGEESAVLNAIEGKRIEPKLKPPFPAESGLWGRPTLINNVETFYNVSLAAAGQYKNNRFYTITGDCPNEGVFELPENFTIAKILKQTKNFPNFSFFVQAGGNASGEALNSGQLRRPAGGAGGVAVYSLAKNNYKKVIKNWLDFFINESCGQCTPCREGVYRLKEEFTREKINWSLFKNLLENLSDSSFCAFGCAVPTPIVSFIRNVLPQMADIKKL